MLLLSTGGVLATDRWHASLAQFAAADQTVPPSSGGIVFVGSSSIRLWPALQQVFGKTVVQRGFGGSRIEDCVRHIELLVLVHRPRVIVLYAGENDLAEGRTPQQVRDGFRAFAERVTVALPQTRIVLVSIKPSPARAGLAPLMQTTNALLREEAAAWPQTTFVDVHAAMLGEDGQPMPALYAADRLHLSAEGYTLWQQTLAPYLR